MHRYHVQRALRSARISALEVNSLLAGVTLIVVAVVGAAIVWDAAGEARLVAWAGFLSLCVCAISRGVRLYRAGTPAALPSSVGRVAVRVRPARAFCAGVVTVSLLLPLAAAVAVLALVDWSWLLVAGVVLLGGAALFVSWVRTYDGRPSYPLASQGASVLLERLCMRADLPVPELVVEADAVANAWTAGGRIHVTTSLIRLLDARELEAVLAHEVAHLARRDAAVMEICSAPSRVLLAYSGLSRGLGRMTDALVSCGVPLRLVAVLWVPAALTIPPAFVIGGIARISVFGMSRAREFAADAAAVALTGSPSALASALMKLDRDRNWVPRSDLRQNRPCAVLCVVGTGRRGLARWLSTHPSIERRVERLERIERRIQRGTAIMPH